MRTPLNIKEKKCCCFNGVRGAHCEHCEEKDREEAKNESLLTKKLWC